MMVKDVSFEACRAVCSRHTFVAKRVSRLTRLATSAHTFGDLASPRDGAADGDARLGAFDGAFDGAIDVATDVRPDGAPDRATEVRPDGAADVRLGALDRD